MGGVARLASGGPERCGTARAARPERRGAARAACPERSGAARRGSSRAEARRLSNPHPVNGDRAVKQPRHGSARAHQGSNFSRSPFSNHLRIKACRLLPSLISWLLPIALMFPSVGTSEYERPQPKPLVVTGHDKPASHPQQVRISIVGTNAMLISWITDDRSASTVVEYGTSPGKYNASETGYSTTYDFLSYKSGAIHNVTIAPLEPSTTYYYRCGNIGNELCLRTPPATLPIEFVIIGDVGQTGWTASTLSQISSTGSHDLLLLPGDLSYADRHQPLWDSWGRQVQPLASAQPWMVTAGNHERERLREPNQPLRQFVAYDARWRMPHDESRSRSNHYYSFDAAGGVVHVVMLGSYAEFEEGSEQHEWLRRDLAAVDRRRTPWVVVLMHVPWYNTNLVHQGEGEGMRTAMERLLYEARVDVVFASHTHAYERFTRIYDNEANAQGPMYITIGDAGNSRAYEFISDHELAHLSVFREASFGHGRLRIVDETRALWTWHRNDDEYATVRDEVWLESLVSARPTVPANACISTTKL